MEPERDEFQSLEPHLSWRLLHFEYQIPGSGARILRTRDTLLQVGQRHYAEVIAWKVLNAPKGSLLKGEHPDIVMMASSSFAHIYLFKWTQIVTVVGVECLLDWWATFRVMGWMISYFTFWNIRAFWCIVIQYLLPTLETKHSDLTSLDYRNIDNISVWPQHLKKYTDNHGYLSTSSPAKDLFY